MEDRLCYRLYGKNWCMLNIWFDLKICKNGFSQNLIRGLFILWN